MTFFNRRLPSVVCTFLLLALTLLTACSSSPDTPAGPDAKGADHPRARSLDLVVTPEATDVTRLDDATLSSRIDMLNKQVNTLTAEVFTMATNPDAGDIERDPAYRAKLRELKIAETKLGDLEMEQHRRQQKR